MPLSGTGALEIPKHLPSHQQQGGHSTRPRATRHLFLVTVLGFSLRFLRRLGLALRTARLLGLFGIATVLAHHADHQAIDLRVAGNAFLGKQQIVRFAGGKAVPLITHARDNFRFDAADLEALIQRTVTELGLFTTTIVTPDNVTTIVGNNKIFSDNIQNYSTLPVRRVDCVAKVANGVDVQDAIARLRPVIAAIPNVTQTPAPDIEILEFTPEGPKLCVRPYTNNEHYWQVYFDTHKAIVDTFGAAGYPVPETPMSYRGLPLPAPGPVQA